MDLSIVGKGLKEMSAQVVKNSPVILTSIGVAGVFTTAGMAIAATPGAMADIEDIQAKNKGKVTKVQWAKVIAKRYWPAALMGVATSSAIIGANDINVRRNAALASAFAIAQDTLKDYQKKVVENIGKSKEEKVQGDIAQDKLNKNPTAGQTIIMTGNGNFLFMDSLSGRYFRSDVEAVRQLQNNFNYTLMHEMYRTLNDLYDDLGIERMELGKQIGWSIETGQLEFIFNTKLADNNEPCIVLAYRTTPRAL